MKKLFFFVLGLTGLLAMAMPAVRKPAHLSTSGDVTVRLHGDEFFNYYTTDDGYTVMRNQHGQWEYARPQDGRLVTTGVAAHNAGARSAQELQLLADVGKDARDESRLAQARYMREQLRQEAQQRASRFDYKRFRGLIILVEYNDLGFEMDNPQEFYNHMVNDENYTGYTLGGKNVSCPGSVRDYYRDQSGGLFDPVFDVVGPVKVDYNSTSHRQTSNTSSIFLSALKSVNSQVDFSLYDGDNDGNIDLVFFIGAGPASSYEGNNSNLLWPHQSSFGTLQTLFTRLDGKKPANYACCTEIYGWQDNPSSMETQGIGVMCHEFSHVLGLSDHYDTDYSSSGGECLTIGAWDIMDEGGSNNVARTPAAYTLYERWSLGWCNPPVITEPGMYTLNALDGTGDGFILKSPDSKEYFTLENRQKTTRWDRYLPGHGMLITRIDSSDVSSWNSNKVNVNPNHLHLELLRAWSNVTSRSLDSDPFPGTRHVVRINNTTTPNLVTWSGKENPFHITRIQEKGGIISFYAYTEGAEQKLVEPFENLPLGLEDDTEAEGVLSAWKTYHATIATYGGSQQVAMNSLGAVYMTRPIFYDMYQVDVDVDNPSATAKFSLYYSLDYGNNWTLLLAASDEQSITVAANSKAKLTWFTNFANTQPVCFMLAMIDGSTTSATYVDNFTVYYTGEPGTGALRGDLNGDGLVDVTDVSILIDMVLGKQPENKEIADLNDDDNIDVGDVSYLIDLVLGQ